MLSITGALLVVAAAILHGSYYLFHQGKDVIILIAVANYCLGYGLILFSLLKGSKKPA